MSRNADGLTPMQVQVSDLLWDTYADPDGGPLIEILDDPRNVAKALEPVLERDEYHTMAELYDYRLLYNAAAAKGWHEAGIPVVRSFFHSDGQRCFGGGWFVVVATLPTGQISNHYKTEYWPMFDGVPTVGKAPDYDGHTPAEAADRLRRWLTEA